MALVGWLDPATDLEEWVDAPADEATVEELLAVAHEKLLEWAPSPIPSPVPRRYKFAQRLLAQHLWARKQAGDGEGFGPEGFMIQTYPLVREAYEAVRPKRSPLRGLL